MSPILTISKRGIAFKFSLIFSMLFFSACTTASEQESSRIEQEQVYSKIDELLSDKSCSTSADCGVLPVGNKACGGPSGYKVYSTLIGDDKISQVKALAERTKQFDKKRNDLGGIMSTCVFLSEPALVCENNLCATSNEAKDLGWLKHEIR